eukprot:2450362-Pyramimonas_sp.AAC.1
MAPNLSKPAAMPRPATTRPASASHNPAPLRESLNAKAKAKAEAKAKAQAESPGKQMELQSKTEAAAAAMEGVTEGASAGID